MRCLPLKWPDGERKTAFVGEAKLSLVVEMVKKKDRLHIKASKNITRTYIPKVASGINTNRDKIPKFFVRRLSELCSALKLR